MRATNDITGAMRRVTEGMRDYYRLTYSPTNTALDGRFRAITVKVRDPEAVVTSRNGYLASPRAATPMVAPHDVAPHVLLDAETLPTDFTLTCDATLASSDIAVAASVGARRSPSRCRPAGAIRGAGSPCWRACAARTAACWPRRARRSRSAALARRSRPRTEPAVAVQQDTARAGAETLEVIAYDVLSGKASARRFKVKDLPPALTAVDC